MKSWSMSSEDGTLKLLTLTPWGLTPLITWRIVPSFPAASMAWMITRSAWVSCAASRAWYSLSSSIPRARSSSASFFLTPEVSAGS